ncbi:MAG: DNA translocase FtsK 4TM domain-containing protein [Anaerolineales bacterium]|jgi:S-DNA-T family DNA segregation ATPase FtsK/SpoIIIE
MADKQSGAKGNRKSRQQPEGLDQPILWRIMQRLRHYADDLTALLLAVATLVTFLALTGLTQGRLVDRWAALLWRWLGWGAGLVPVVFAAAAILLFLRRIGRSWEMPWARLIGLEFAFTGVLGFFSVLDGVSLTGADQGRGGGLVGWVVAKLLGDLLGGWGSTIVLVLITLLAAIYSMGPFVLTLRDSWRQFALQRKSVSPSKQPSPSITEPSKREDQRSAQPKTTKKHLPREYRKDFRLQETVKDEPAKPQARDKRLPSLELLDQGEPASITAKEINQAAGLIEKTLADFGLPVSVLDFRTGPTVTQFAVEPGYIEQVGANGEARKHKVRVSQIVALADDLALALSAPRLRIEAPVPGHPYVGIEVPNRRSSIVRLRPILESAAFQAVDSPLAICLGRDVAGKAVTADLIAMPHLLIAGTTGSGKSVCIVSLAACLIANNTPDDLRLVLIDPKMVELVRFNGLPHLLGKVETELDRISSVLRWCTKEMDQRYRLLEEARARDIDDYNKRIRRKRNVQRMPRIVIMIDELADLMMMAPDQTERTLVRLAQMARATGIHLVLATQRPSTDILTGLIKANCPARISFATASGVDSRVILDGPGAETLLGRGDMLYLSPEAAAPARLQGVFVSDREVEALVDYWRQEAQVEAGEPLDPAPWEEMVVRQEALQDRDEILERAIALVKQSGQASASMLQRRLRIGYPRAARLMDELEELGVIGRPQSGGRTREVLIEKDDDPLINRDGETDLDEDRELG